MSALFRLASAVLVAAAVATATPVLAADAADFYKGNTLRLVVGYSPGGGVDAYSRMLARHAGGAAPFHCVAFHPHFPEDLADEHRAVRFIRRSPDPSVQLVRASLLQTLRHADPSGTHYVDTAGLSAAELMALSAPLPVAERIARANLGTLNQARPEHLRELLAEISVHARQPDR